MTMTKSNRKEDDAAPALILGWKRKHVVLAAFVICLELIVVLVFAIMLAMKNNSDDQNNNEMPTFAPTTLRIVRNPSSSTPTTTTNNPTSAPTTNTTNMTSSEDNNNGTIPCVEDSDCNFVIDVLGPLIPPNTTPGPRLELPATCQQKAREWLNATTTMTPALDEMRTSQRYALAVFYCEMNGDNWTRNDNWLSEEAHECEWYNTEDAAPCDIEGRLTSLRLPNNGLSGALPSELDRLSFLIELDLSNNRIMHGIIPTAYDTMINLKIAQLSSIFHDFIPGLPPGLFRMWPRLQRLELANNGFFGELPTDLPDYMPQLTHLDLGNNSLYSEIPSNFGELNLHQLHLQANDLIGTIPPELFQPPNLESLYFHDNVLSGIIPIDNTTVDNFLKQKHLTEATFYGNYFLEGSIAEDICDRISLEEDAWVNIHVNCAQISCSCCLCTPLEPLEVRY